jgi:hypothetical protein
MANSIGILNEGFKKYESIKPSFEDELYEAMKSLTERQQEWSDEDKHDNEILWSIIDKLNANHRYEVTPEEQAVLDKYGFEASGCDDGADYKLKNLMRGENSSAYGPVNRKINVPDRARKRPERAKNKDTWNDGIRKYNRDVDDMKQWLRGRKALQQKIDGIDNNVSEWDRDALKWDNVIQDYQQKINRAEERKRQALDNKAYNRDNSIQFLNSANQQINKLLKRESLSKKRMNESRYLTGEYAYVVEDIADRAKSYKDEDPDWDMSDCISAAIDDGLIYTDDQWAVLTALYGDPIQLFTDQVWEDLYNDIYAEIGDYPDEDLEESLKLKKNRKINEAEEDEKLPYFFVGCVKNYFGDDGYAETTPYILGCYLGKGKFDIRESTHMRTIPVRWFKANKCYDRSEAVKLIPDFKQWAGMDQDEMKVIVTDDPVDVLVFVGLENHDVSFPYRFERFGK